MCSRHAEYGAGYDITDATMDYLQDTERLAHGPQPHAPAPEPIEYRGTNTCKACGCRWVMYDLSEPNPIQALCFEPCAAQFYRYPCLCHSPEWVNAYLDERDRLAETPVLDI